LQQSLGQQGHQVSHAALDLRTFATHVAVQLARRQETGLCADDLQHFFARSLGGAPLARYVHQALTWLTDPLRALAFADEYDRYHLTVLGLKVVRAVLPVHIASGYGQLLRDLLSIDASDRLLAGWQPLDHMIVLHLLTDYAPPLRAFSTGLCDQVEAWIETTPTRTPILYREWIAGSQETSRAIEITGSLGLTPPGKAGHAESWAYKAAYMAVFRAIMLYERGEGKEVAALERRWKIKDLEGIEERWRDALLWLLAGVAQMLDVRCFYFHLRGACTADTARIRRVKQAFQRMRAQVFDLQDHLRYCSPLGPVLRSLRRTRLAAPGPSMGVQTIRHLEEAGIHSLAELASLNIDALVQLGIRRHLAKQLYTYVRRRLQ
jgi:hypothetical protein